MKDRYLNQLISINKKQSLYNLKCGNGFSYIGFYVVLERSKALCIELNIPFVNHKPGTKQALKQYDKLLEIAEQKNKETGWRSQSELYKPFIGNEGKRVEVIWKNGEKERFYIGKSTGFIPCHLIIKTSRSSGGIAVMNDFVKSFRFV